MNKIQKIEWLETNHKEVVNKINEIIDVVNSEALSDKEVTNSQDSYQEEGRCKLKQKECENDCVQRYPSSKDWCDKHKQSTSLKEEIHKILLCDFCNELPCEYCKSNTEQILSLLQSHLVKEINAIDSKIYGFSYRPEERIREDIIKIINIINK